MPVRQRVRRAEKVPTKSGLAATVKPRGKWAGQACQYKRPCAECQTAVRESKATERENKRSHVQRTGGMSNTKVIPQSIKVERYLSATQGRPSEFLGRNLTCPAPQHAQGSLSMKNAGSTANPWAVAPKSTASTWRRLRSGDGHLAEA